MGRHFSGSFQGRSVRKGRWGWRIVRSLVRGLVSHCRGRLKKMGMAAGMVSLSTDLVAEGVGREGLTHWLKSLWNLIQRLF